jgi:hypothetical protein
MTLTLRNSAIALALIGTAAIAATPALALHLRDRDRTIIYETITSTRKNVYSCRRPPAGTRRSALRYRTTSSSSTCHISPTFRA